MRQIFVNVYIFFCHAICWLPVAVTYRQFYVKLIPSASADGGFRKEAVDSVVDCLYECITARECLSASFNKTERLCTFYSSVFYPDMKRGSDLLSALVEKAAGDEKLSPSNPPLSSLLPVTVSVSPSSLPDKAERQWRVVTTDSPITFSQCTRKCGLGRNLIQIDNEQKQAAAVKLAEAKDVDNVAVGVYYWIPKNQWFYVDKTPVNYTAWAPREPRPFSLFAALAKTHNYKWVGVSRRFKHFICDN